MMQIAKYFEQLHELYDQNDTDVSYLGHNKGWVVFDADKGIHRRVVNIEIETDSGLIRTGSSGLFFITKEFIPVPLSLEQCLPHDLRDTTNCHKYFSIHDADDSHYENLLYVNKSARRYIAAYNDQRDPTDCVLHLKRAFFSYFSFVAGEVGSPLSDGHISARSISIAVDKSAALTGIILRFRVRTMPPLTTGQQSTEHCLRMIPTFEMNYRSEMSKGAFLLSEGYFYHLLQMGIPAHYVAMAANDAMDKPAQTWTYLRKLCGVLSRQKSDRKPGRPKKSDIPDDVTPPWVNSPRKF